jgi:uncharacterized protein
MSNTIDQQFIEYIVKSLVGNPDAVEIKRTIDEKGVLLELTVDPQDLGRVIGKRGAGAQALRTLLRALGTKNDARYNLKIVDNGEPYERRERPERSEEPRDEQPREDRGSEEQQAAPEEAPATDEETPEEPREETSSVADRTRKELADLDDLDI